MKTPPAFVSAIDLAPTLCHMVGIDDQAQMHGRNAWDLVTGKAHALRRETFTRFANFAAVRNPQWHYFQHVEGHDLGAGPCLYDLQADPGETKNVVQSHPEIAAELQSRLADRLGQKLPEPASGGKGLRQG